MIQQSKSIIINTIEKTYVDNIEDDQNSSSRSGIPILRRIMSFESDLEDDDMVQEKEEEKIEMDVNHQEYNLIDDKQQISIISSSPSLSKKESDVNLSWYMFFKRTLLTQINFLIKDFSNNGLPWSGSQCRSIMAGGSGVLFLLPVLACNNNRLDQAIWIVQAFLSVWADYFHVDRPSVAHGLDRVSAQFVFWSMVFRSATELQWWACLFGFIPTICFCGANHAKASKNLNAWHRWHCAWHVTGSVGVTMIVFLMHHCPSGDVSSPMLQEFCKA